MNQEKVGKFILKLRKQNNLTQKEFAARLNVTAQAVSKWENGRGLPDIEFLQKISKEFNVNIDSILSGEKPRKKSYKKFIIIFCILLILLITTIYTFLNPSDYSFSDIESKNTKFNIKGVAAYSSAKNSIYISDIEYLDGDENKKYIAMECILYESHHNLEEKVSQYGSLTKKMKEPKTLSELLKEAEFKVENFSCTNKNIKKSQLYISINVLDTNKKITKYKIPLQLTGNCN